MSAPTHQSSPKVEQRGNARVITFTADAVCDVGDVLARELQGRTGGLGAGHLLLEFSNVAYLASAELGTLVAVRKPLRSAGGGLTLFDLNARVYEILTTTHLQTLLSICRVGETDPGETDDAAVLDGQVDGAETTVNGCPGDPDKFVMCE
jgi:anti-anti-sigma factor